MSDFTFAPTIRVKQPTESLAYDFDFSYEGGIGPDDSIASVTSITHTACGVIPAAAALTLATPVFSGRIAQTIISGGSHAEAYKLTAIIEDTSGQIHELDGFLEVRDL